MLYIGSLFLCRITRTQTPLIGILLVQPQLSMMPHPTSRTNAQLIVEPEQSQNQATSAEAKNLHAGQNMGMGKLKVALANETVALETERTAEWEMFTER